MRFILKTQLGEGEFFSVHLGSPTRDLPDRFSACVEAAAVELPEAEPDVAIKFLRMSYRDREQFERQSRTEVRALRRIQHPNVIGLRAFCERAVFSLPMTEGRFETALIVLEAAQGGELFDLLETTGPFSEVWEAFLSLSSGRAQS